MTYTGHCNFQDYVLLELLSRLIVDAIDKSSHATSKKGVLSMSGGLFYMNEKRNTSDEVRTKSTIDRQLLRIQVARILRLSRTMSRGRGYTYVSSANLGKYKGWYIVLEEG